MNIVKRNATLDIRVNVEEWIKLLRADAFNAKYFKKCQMYGSIKNPIQKNDFDNQKTFAPGFRFKISFGNQARLTAWYLTYTGDNTHDCSSSSATIIVA